jgi:type II restriction enzyme
LSSPNINTYREITPLIYSWSTPDIPKYDGWEKIGYTEQDSAAARIAQQASQLSVTKVENWVRRAFYTSAAGGAFRDGDFHAYLRQLGVERELKPQRTEWHHFDGAARSSIDYFNAFAGQDFTEFQKSGEDDYQLRPEQVAAVEQALAVFNEGGDEVLWNAKPRFGKTLTTYDLMRKIDARKVLIVTNRPAIANSWFDDFDTFIGHQTSYKFVSESPSLASRSVMTRAQWRAYVNGDSSQNARIVEFVSLQDLKGSQYFGGVLKKLKHIADCEWDLLVVDEAHEGIDTTKTDVAFEQITRAWTLHLSGTPFKALASGRFSQDQIFNWTYEDEQSARASWDDESVENPYGALPQLNMLTYQISRMITDRLAVGVASDEDGANIDFTFDLNEFFSTKDNGFFEHEAEVVKFLDSLSTNEKYPFSTPELRDEIRHSFWLLNRVASAKALQRLLKSHAVFKDYDVILAAGNGREDDADLAVVGKSLDNVRTAIRQAEKNGGNTITLSVGQLTTGVTVPEWTAVIMLSNLSSPALYMQAAFRAQNPCTFERGGKAFQKKNAYIFDFAPERTLTILDQFANNLSSTPSGDQSTRQDNIRELLNFFPVIGEDSEGRMVELDAAQVLTFPQALKAREVVRRGFLSNLLFANVAGIFKYPEHVKAILEKLPEAKQGKTKTGGSINLPEPVPSLDADGNVQVDFETVINPKVAELGKPVWRAEDVSRVDRAGSSQSTARQVAKLVTEKSREIREKLAKDYSLSAKQVERDEKQTEARVVADVERVLTERSIAEKRLEDALQDAATEADAAVIQQEKVAYIESFNADILALVNARTDEIGAGVIAREETKREQKRANETMDDARSHLRGFARTIPMFLMAYGDRNLRLANFDAYTPDDVFEEITGITEADFRVLRDGQKVTEEDGSVVQVPGLFDEAVFDRAVQEFLDKKELLADYFDKGQTEDIFAYIPHQKTSLVFTPRSVVEAMVDTLESENPGIFEDQTKTFADLFSTAGLFLMELVRRLNTGLASVIPDQEERLRHILTKQIFEMSHNELLHKITIEAISGGVSARREWIQESDHFRFGDIARMSVEERERVIDEMLTEGS